MSEQIIEISCNNLDERYSFNKVARQASGAVLYHCGDAVLLAAVAIDPKPVDEDFLPLTVQYIEKAYAAARIPGGFIKRETKPGDFETLTSRIVDRSLRPLFPKGFHYPVVLTVTVLSTDPKVDMQVAALHAASAALYTADIPVNQVVSAVRLGKIDDEVLINPTLVEQENSTLDLLVVGSGSDIVMIEMCVKASQKEYIQSINELDEDEFVEIIDIAQGAIGEATTSYQKGFESAKKDEIEISLAEDREDQELYKFIEENYAEAVSSAVQSMAKSERSQALKDVRQTIMDALEAKGEEADKELVSKMLNAYKKSVVRSLILDKSIRADGRAFDEVRQIDIETNILPSVHGSCLFTRGQTQALVTATLGDNKSSQVHELITSKNAHYETFMVHYNFPGFSVGEAKPARAPGRRELGHGNLAKRGLEPTLDLRRDGTVRLVSEILESNGSSSMATVCGGSLALKAAEVDSSKLVAGIAMGLITDGTKNCVLSDIMGLEDHDGDMDFKITGTADGITAMQMDIKLGGIEAAVLKEALHQAKEGRLHILNIMEEALANLTPSQALPSSILFDIDSSHIPAIIGKGGGTIREIIEKYAVSIDIDRDANSVKITGDSKESVADAKAYIDNITSAPVKKQMKYEINKQYAGKIKKIVEFGMFIEMPDGYDALLHISKVTKERIKTLDGVYNVGDAIDIIVLEQKGKKVELCTPAYLF
ncbi:polyribonucleotide nucleotidyltransferase [Sulfurovum sp. bin170]|uniref:polyribonucleotide nucleotidyltransferase n=1 Tax=Sulfurovum sp. bin170 TaxID=2695268 RepID=UPI0013DF87AB|nr:polyribonucleotide nucleotidyltransferase [Sulfurovum sp. bin170]NEW60305.1 polyribonucleotide nucleotidyltransferase [Sulfurovum sp. bin170]